MTGPSLVWFRKDLRLSDNPALTAALRRGGPVVCLFVRDEATEGALPVGGASAWWLHHSLTALADSLTRRGGSLILKTGNPGKIIPDLCKRLNVDAVFWNRCYEPAAIARDSALKSALGKDGLHVDSFNGSLLREPWDVKTKAGGSYSVFTPFWKALCALGDPPAPQPAPDVLPGMPVAQESEALADWALLPTTPDWSGGIRDNWQPGEEGARECLSAFLDAGVGRYGEYRNRPDKDGTSRLSPHLAFGEISPREIWHIARDVARREGGSIESGVWSFLREIGWRDFNHNLLFNNPDMPNENYNGKFDAFRWNDNPGDLEAWHKGRTGYPLVDAGMRELWHTGFMHNRVRMVVASFLVKHLLIDWRRGEAWFRDTLVDADLANNVANWQWVAGCGADAAPYFRIFNPIGQGEKFDPNGVYIRRWVPEIAALPDKYLNQPWTAPDGVLEESGITLGRTYPKPIVEHRRARERALNAYDEIKGAA